jgi:hypothetical protein
MTLQEKIDWASKLTEDIINAHPNTDGLWFTFSDIPLAEMQSVAEKYGKKLEYRQDKQMMQMNSHTFDNSNATIFCYSKKVKIQDLVIVGELEVGL